MSTAQLALDAAESCKQLSEQVEAISARLEAAEAKLSQIRDLVSIVPRTISVNGKSEQIVSLDDVVDFMSAIARLTDAGVTERAAFKDLALGIGDLSAVGKQAQEKPDVEPA